MALVGSTGSTKKQAAKAKTKKVVTAAVKSGAITKRGAKVIRTGAKEITQGNRPISATRFQRSATRTIAKGKPAGYKKALIKSAATSTTKAEAKGVKKVLSRQGPARSGNRTRRKYGR